MVLSRGHYDSFVVRIWSPNDHGRVTHGQIVHVRTQQRLSFREVQEILPFILAHAVLTAQPPLTPVEPGEDQA